MRTLIVVCVLAFGAVIYSTVLATRVRQDLGDIVRLVALLHPMQDVLFIQHESDWYAIIRQDGESDEAFATRMAGIQSGVIDPSSTHLCQTVSGCSEGRTVTVCIAILPGTTQQQNEAKLASLKTAVCNAIGCTVGCE